MSETLEPEVEECFQDFWYGLVCPGGTWDLDQVKRELHDYHTLITEVPKAYMEVTCGRVSKPNTLASVVIDLLETLWHRDDECPLDKARALTATQAEDPDLWRRDGGKVEDGGVPVTMHERILQTALRELHSVIEDEA